MPLEPMSIALLALLGLLGGFMAGLLGIGGGMILVPFTSAILAAQGVGAELALKMAIATSMATIVFTSISSVRAHHRRGAVRQPGGVCPHQGACAGGGVRGFRVFFGHADAAE